MTRDDIIRMALEAGFGCDTDGRHLFTDNRDGICDEYLERFAVLVAEREREACAIAGGAAAMAGLNHLQVAAAIRARGEKP